MLRPNDYRKTYSEQDLNARIKQLMGVDKKSPTLNESVNRNANSTLVAKHKGANGLTYGILQESSSYYIKQTTKSLNEATASDFEYIGGMNNKLSEKFENYHKAANRLNAKLYSLNESFPKGAPGEAPVDGAGDIEAALLDKLDAKEAGEEVAPEGEGAPLDVPLDAPLDGEAPVDAPVDGGEGAPLDVPADGGENPFGGEDAPAADGGEGAPLDGGEAPVDPTAPVDGTAAPEGEEGVEGGEGEGGTKEVQRLTGQLTQELSVTEKTPEMIMQLYNSIISATKDVLAEVSPEDKQELIDRLQRNGEQVNETQGSAALTAEPVPGSAALGGGSMASPAPVGGGPEPLMESGFYGQVSPDDRPRDNGEESEGPSFLDIVSSGGYNHNDDKAMITALVQFAKEFSTSGNPTQKPTLDPEDLDAIGTIMNPLIWSTLENHPEWHKYGQKLDDAIVDKFFDNETGYYAWDKQQSPSGAEAQGESAPLQEGLNALDVLVEQITREVIANRNK